MDTGIWKKIAWQASSKFLSVFPNNFAATEDLQFCFLFLGLIPEISSQNRNRQMEGHTVFREEISFIEHKNEIFKKKICLLDCFQKDNRKEIIL